MIAILIPCLNRPARVGPLVESIRAASLVIPCVPYFICTPGDDKQRKAIDKTGAYSVVLGVVRGPGDYARKINTGVKVSSEPFLFLASDDLYFHPGWAERAVACWYETGACVVGTNDLGNVRVTAGRHSTHTLVHRDYVECGTVDDDTVLLHEGYDHNFVDDEFIQTAESRETYAKADDAIVEHLHPNWGKAKDDTVYRLGMARFNEDRALYQRRSRLWA